MSDTPTPTRGPVTRWYIDGDDMIGRSADRPDERYAIEELPERLLVEGYVALRSRGYTDAQIRSGAAYGDRSLPAEKGAKPRRMSKNARWREAIAQAIAHEEAGANPTPKQVEEAREYAAALSKSDVKDYAGRVSVLAVYARMFGDKAPLRQRVPAAAE